jgi:hypothetical protein
MSSWEVKGAPIESPYRSLHRPGQGDLTAVNRCRVSRLRRLVNGVGLFLAVCVGIGIVLFANLREAIYRVTVDQEISHE